MPVLSFQSLIRIRLMPCLHAPERRVYAKRTETAEKSTKTFNNRVKFKMASVKWKHGKSITNSPEVSAERVLKLSDNV